MTDEQVEATARIIKGCIFIGDELAPWMKTIAPDYIDGWSETLARVALEAAEEAGNADA